MPDSIDDEIEAFITRPAPADIDWRIWQAIRATSRSSALAYLLGALNDEINARNVTAESVTSVIRNAMEYATKIEAASAAGFVDASIEP
ncbi:MAG TPA: hypothetical protein VL551_09140 [Actinospica sp.]|nr:hypothetical protein [Actinospica sp.]